MIKNRIIKIPIKKYGRFNFSTRYRISDRFTVSLTGNLNSGNSGAFFYHSLDSYYVGQRTASSSTVSSRKRFRYNLDPKITYFDKAGNRHRFQSRVSVVDNDIITEADEDQSNSSTVLYGEYQFQKKISAIDFCNDRRIGWNQNNG